MEIIVFVLLKEDHCITPYFLSYSFALKPLPSGGLVMKGTLIGNPSSAPANPIMLIMLMLVYHPG